jgi:malate permease and related proteins
LKVERTALISILITSMFANTGNYGLPLVLFAFGEKALSYAGIYFVTTTLLFYSLGVLLASLGHMNFKDAMLGLFRVPTLYAVLLALPSMPCNSNFRLPCSGRLTWPPAGRSP